jgi:hypothetical protein
MPFGSPRFHVATTTAVALLSSVWLSGCHKEGCLGGEAGCQVASPCPELDLSEAVTTCTDRTVELLVLGAPPPGSPPGTAAAERPGGLDAHGAHGDFLLRNGVTEAVVANLGHQTFLDPNGGALLDLGVRGKANDSLNQVLTVTGILPQDAAHYTEVERLDTCEGVDVPCKALQFKGTLDGQPHVRIATRYEVRACEPGIRVRTEVVNGTPDPQLWALSDGFYWSGREAYPFVPAEGTGFQHPSFDLLSINGAFRGFPYLAANGYAAPQASYALTACNAKAMRGFNSSQISAAGLGQKVVNPRDYLVYERFLAVTDGDDLAAGADVALEVRRQLFGEDYVTLRGTVDRDGLPVGSEAQAALLISEGTASTPRERWTPWTQVVPGADGRWSARVPEGRDYVIELRSHGRAQADAERHLSEVGEDQDVGTLAVRRSARVTLRVQDPDRVRQDALVLVVPADEATAKAAEGSLYTASGACSPWLGPPQGGSPACNRVLVSREPAAVSEVDLPAGRYHLYATRGPFWTIARQTVDLQHTTDGEVTLTLSRLGSLRPLGAVGADLHVHGAQSFDSSIPDVDRVRSFAALDLDVIAATDHEVVYDYTSVVRQLGYDGQMTAIPGVETTGHVLWMKTPGSSIPKVIGHYNFWPLAYDPTRPRNGGPFDEEVEPGELFERVKTLATSEPVFQLNHPYADAEFGRDLGFPRALGMDLTKDLPSDDDGTSNGMYVRRSGATGLRNSDHHAQEVMNGTQNDLLLPYRAFWFYTLNQGHLRAGTANSDTHSLVDNTVGLPRNLVYAGTQAGPTFDMSAFNDAVRAGRVLGTNGPLVEAAVVDPDGTRHAYGLTPFRPAAGARLEVQVSAAPWVPVDEVRIVVNGREERVITEGIERPSDPFGDTGLVRFTGTLPLAELLPASGDAWLVVEAGRRLLLAGDLGGGPGGVPDGVPDTTDNNGDGKVDAADVAAGATTGPLKNPPLSTDAASPDFHFGVVVSGGYPMAFTNPFILDRDGNGFRAPRVGGGN